MAGIFDMITGQNPNQGAINTQNSNSDQATAAQNQIIQQALLPLYNTMLSQYSTDYAPLSDSLGSNLGGATSALNLGGTASGATGLFNSEAGMPNSYAPTTNQATTMFQNEATNGLSPQSIGAAMNPFMASSQSNLNSIMNNLGSSTPNMAGTAAQLNLQNLQGDIGLQSALAGQNQQFQNTGATNAINAQQGLVTNANSGAQNAMSTQTGLLTALQNFLSGGNNLLTGGSSGMNSLANMYGSAATGAANNAMNLTNQGNSSNSSTMGGLAGLAGSIFPYL
jgi:hypothetical protein